MSLAEAKAALRKDIFAKRKEAFAERAAKDGAANARLGAYLDGVKAGIVAGYRPIRTEIDPTPTMTALIMAGRRVCVPVIEAAGKPLKFREWAPGCAMTEGAFGAEIPAEGAWLEPEALIVPLVGWDRQGWRLGYGGGFYDRSLEGLRAKRPTLAIGFAYAAQEVPEAPREPTDQQLDAVVTEAEVMEVAR